MVCFFGRGFLFGFLAPKATLRIVAGVFLVFPSCEVAVWETVLWVPIFPCQFRLALSNGSILKVVSWLRGLLIAFWDSATW